jgi:hypothetical protein
MIVHPEQPQAPIDRLPAGVWINSIRVPLPELTYGQQDLAKYGAKREEVGLMTAACKKAEARLQRGIDCRVSRRQFASRNRK